MDKVNYNKRVTRKTKLVDKKKFVMAILLTGSLSLNAVNAINKTVEVIKDEVTQAYRVNDFKDYVNDNIHRTSDKQHYFIDNYDMAKDFIEKAEINSRQDFYHQIILLAQNIDYNRNSNFEDFIRSLNLDKLNKEDSIYPSEYEFKEFLYRYDLIDSEGKINFKRWIEFDKQIFNVENEFSNKSK